MSALRISVPGKPVRLILLGHDEPVPVPLFRAAITAMSVPGQGPERPWHSGTQEARMARPKVAA